MPTHFLGHSQFQWFDLFQRAHRTGEPFDIATFGWSADYLDPAAMLNQLLETGAAYFPALDNAVYQRRLVDTEQLVGPGRYLAYSRLAADLARDAAPLVAFGNGPAGSDFFSARVGCQNYNLYGLDLAALCIRPPGR